MFDLKFQQLKDEEELIKNGKHPEFLSQMQEIEDRHAFHIRACNSANNHREENIQKMFESQLQFADETFMVSCLLIYLGT